MNTQKKLIVLLLRTIIGLALIMLIVGCPIDSDNNDSSSDTTAPTIISSAAGTKKVVITFSEAIKFGSVGNADGTGFTVEAGTAGSLDAAMDITVAISGSMLTLTLDTALTNAQTHVKVDFADNAVTDTAGNILATNASTGELAVDTTTPTITLSYIESFESQTSIQMLSNEQIVFGPTVGTTLPLTGSIGILSPSGFTIETGNTDSLGTTAQILSAQILPVEGHATFYVLSFTIAGKLPTGFWAQVTFGADTIIDLAGNAVAKDTKSNKIQVQAAP